jgi:hypothetical protein
MTDPLPSLLHPSPGVLEPSFQSGSGFCTHNLVLTIRCPCVIKTGLSLLFIRSCDGPSVSSLNWVE